MSPDEKKELRRIAREMKHPRHQCEWSTIEEAKEAITKEARELTDDMM